jgi:hypothetical protein
MMVSSMPGVAGLGTENPECRGGRAVTSSGTVGESAYDVRTVVFRFQPAVFRLDLRPPLREFPAKNGDEPIRLLTGREVRLLMENVDEVLPPLRSFGEYIFEASEELFGTTLILMR